MPFLTGYIVMHPAPRQGKEKRGISHKPQAKKPLLWYRWEAITQALEDFRPDNQLKLS